MAGKKNYINATVWAEDGCRFDVKGEFPNEVCFAIYMLLCRGTGSTDETTTDSKAIKRFVGQMRAYYKRTDNV